MWSKNFTATANFEWATGIQDCSRNGSPGAGAFGEPAKVIVWDWALGKKTYEIPVRTQVGGVCTANQG